MHSIDIGGDDITKHLMNEFQISLELADKFKQVIDIYQYFEYHNEFTDMPIEKNANLYL